MSGKDSQRADKKDKGLVMVNTGPGKGKTTAAFGLALRSIGQGQTVSIWQFIKGPTMYGEQIALSTFPGLTIKQLGLGLIRKDADRIPHQEAAQAGFKECRKALLKGTDNLYILDEICVALDYGFIRTEDVLDLIRNRPDGIHIVLTGRNCPQEIIEVADTVSFIEDIKHHLAGGITAQAGIEY